MVYHIYREGEKIPTTVNIDGKVYKRFDMKGDIRRQNEFKALVAEGAFVLARRIGKDEARDIIVETNNLYVYSILMVAHDKLGFGHKRLMRLLEQLEDQMDSLQEGRIKLQEVKDILKKEAKVEFKFKDGVREVDTREGAIESEYYKKKH